MFNSVLQHFATFRAILHTLAALSQGFCVSVLCAGLTTPSVQSSVRIAIDLCSRTSSRALSDQQHFSHPHTLSAHFHALQSYPNRQQRASKHCMRLVATSHTAAQIQGRHFPRWQQVDRLQSSSACVHRQHRQHSERCTRTTAHNLGVWWSTLNLVQCLSE